MTTFEKLSVPRPPSPTTTEITRCPPRRERAPQPPRLLLAPPCAPRYSFARGPPWHRPAPLAPQPPPTRPMPQHQGQRLDPPPPAVPHNSGYPRPHPGARPPQPLGPSHRRPPMPSTRTPWDEPP